MSHGNSPKSEFEPTKKLLNCSSLLVWLVVKSSWPPSWRFLLIALVRRNAAFYTSSSKIASYWFGIVSSICQNLLWSGFRPTSTVLILTLMTTCWNLRLSCSLPSPKIIARGRDSELTTAWAFTPLRRLCPLYRTDSPPFLNRWACYRPLRFPSWVCRLHKLVSELQQGSGSKHLLSTIA